MKRSFSYAVILFLLSGLFVFAFAQSLDREQEDHLLTFLEGTYDAVGKYPQHGTTYCGVVTLKREQRKIIMTRVIQGKKTAGSARIVAVTGDNIPVLQADFTENGQTIRTTYMIHSDIDNYGRLTGRTYYTGRDKISPGLEALFIRRSSDGLH